MAAPVRDPKPERRHSTAPVFRVFKVALQKGSQLVQLGFSDQLLTEHPGPRVLYEIKQQHATSMTHRLCVYPRLHANIRQPGCTHQTRHLRADCPVDPVHLGRSVEQLEQAGLGVVGWIASLRA